MLPILLIAAALTATFSPARPTVGDPVTIEFAEGPVRLDPSPQYEIVSQEGSRAVVRTFLPQPVVLSGVAGSTRFANLILPVHSVLTPGDDLRPAPLQPPRAAPYPRQPFVAIGIAAVAAAIAWLAVWIVARRTRAVPVVVVPPAEEFRRTVTALRLQPHAPARWGALADATRRYLSRRGFGSELTTTELLAQLGDSADAALIGTILRCGDLEKFSPWGAPDGDFRDVAGRALDLPSRFEPPPEEEAAA